MRYCLLMHYQEGSSRSGLTEEDMAPAMAAFAAIRRRSVGRRSADHHRSARHPSTPPRPSPARNGAPEIQDGPFADTKEKLGGIFVIDVANLDEALKWAQRNPANGWGSVEIRPVARTYAAERGWYNP